MIQRKINFEILYHSIIFAATLYLSDQHISWASLLYILSFLFFFQYLPNPTGRNTAVNASLPRACWSRAGFSRCHFLLHPRDTDTPEHRQPRPRPAWVHGSLYHVARSGLWKPESVGRWIVKMTKFMR